MASLVVSPKSVAVVVSQKRREGAGRTCGNTLFAPVAASGRVDSYEAQTVRSDEPCGARKRDCNTLRGLVSNGNENIERFRKAVRNW